MVLPRRIALCSFGDDLLHHSGEAVHFGEGGIGVGGNTDAVDVLVLDGGGHDAVFVEQMFGQI